MGKLKDKLYNFTRQGVFTRERADFGSIRLLLEEIIKMIEDQEDRLKYLESDPENIVARVRALDNPTGGH